MSLIVNLYMILVGLILEAGLYLLWIDIIRPLLIIFIVMIVALKLFILFSLLSYLLL